MVHVPACHAPVKNCKIETKAASREFESYANPVALDDLAAWILRLNKPQNLHHSVSFTGGEPLLHAETIRALSPILKADGLKLYLETDGHLVPELKRVVAFMDLVGMDIKIESSAGFPAKHRENAEFLAVLNKENTEHFVKIVVAHDSTDSELTNAFQVVAAQDDAIQTIIQPVTPFGGKGIPPSPERLLEIDFLARSQLKRVLVIPQTHKMLKQL